MRDADTGAGRGTTWEYAGICTDGTNDGTNAGTLAVSTRAASCGVSGATFAHVMTARTSTQVVIRLYPPSHQYTKMLQ